MDNAPPTTQRISEFHRWQIEGRLELSPPFQRKPVWSLKNKSYLIDTIINGLPVPEIYIQVKTDKEGNTKYIVVDGQQRIRAILEFIDKEYEILEEDNSALGGKQFDQLPDGVKQEFWNYGLVVRELKSAKDTEVREIFQRLNKNVVPLNRQELRHAAYGGKFHSLAYQLSEDDYWSDNKIVTPNDVRRMIDASFVSELLIVIIKGIQQREEDNIDEIYKLYDQTFAQENDVKQQFIKTRNRIDEILGDLRSTRWHFKAEFYSLFAALNELSKEYSVPSENIGVMRNRLEKFSSEVDQTVVSNEGKSNVPLVAEFANTVIASTTLARSRNERNIIVRKLMIPHLIPKDAKREFNEEERRIIWELSKDKSCAICGKKVASFDDFQAHHKVPHSKGGKTEISNGAISHLTCNAKKGNR